METQVKLITKEDLARAIGAMADGLSVNGAEANLRLDRAWQSLPAQISPSAREVEAERMLLMFTTPLPTCGGMRLLEFTAKLGEREALGVLCRQYGWDATKLPRDLS